MELIRGWESQYAPDVTGGLRLSRAGVYRTIGEEEGLGDGREGEIRVNTNTAITRNEGDGGLGPSAFFPVTVSVTHPDGSEVTAKNLGSGERREIAYSARVDDSGIDSPFLFCLSREPVTQDDWKALQAALPHRYDTWTATESITDLSFEIQCAIKRWMAQNRITEHRIDWYKGWVTYPYDVIPPNTEISDFGKEMYERWFRKGRRYSGQQEYRLAWAISSPQMEKFPDEIEIELTRTGLSLFKPWSPPTQ